MSPTTRKYGFVALKVALALPFLAAGAAKLAGAEAMVQTFDALGTGQWFRYVTGAIEIAAAALLFVPGLQAVGAALLTATMAGAVIAHLTVLGPSAVPALVLGLLAAVVLYAHRDQLPGIRAV